jgi:hypothetical protein
LAFDNEDSCVCHLGQFLEVAPLADCHIREEFEMIALPEASIFDG